MPPHNQKSKFLRIFELQKNIRSIFRTQKRASRQVTEVIVRGKWPKKANAQRLSPVMRWAFYTVACTALCGPVAKHKPQVLPCDSRPCK